MNELENFRGKVLLPSIVKITEFDDSNCPHEEACKHRPSDTNDSESEDETVHGSTSEEEALSKKMRCNDEENNNDEMMQPTEFSYKKEPSLEAIGKLTENIENDRE